MKRKRRRPTAEELARSQAVWQRLRERLAYHQARLAEERGADTKKS